MDHPSSIRFGGFILNRERGRLEDRTGAERFLRPKSYRVLEVLCERHGQLVSKDDLVCEAWPDLFVSDDSLAHCVSDIRRALGREGSNLLRTVPKRGYMLAAPAPLAEALAQPRAKLPMAWASGLAVALAVTAAIVLWGMPREGLQAVPNTTLSSLRQADALLETRDWRRREDNERARALLETAAATAPESADTWASLGLTYWLEVQHIAWGGGRREMRRALELVEHAVALGGSARSHRLLAEMRLLSPFAEMRSPIDALANARAAVAIDGDDADNLAVLAQALALTGRAKDAVGVIEHALRLEPSPPDWRLQVAGLTYLLAGDPARAAEKLGPIYGAGTFGNARWWPGWLFAASLAHAGRIEEAARVVAAVRPQRPERSVAAVAQSFAGFADEQGLRLLLDGLRLAGMPG